MMEINISACNLKVSVIEKMHFYTLPAIYLDVDFYDSGINTHFSQQIFLKIGQNRTESQTLRFDDLS